MVSKTHCAKHGSPLVEGGVTTRYRYCPFCVRERAAQRRHGDNLTPINPVDVSGARDRLRAYIDQHAEAICAILDLVADRRPDYIGGRAA